MSYSLAHSKLKIGFSIIARLGYQANWLFMGCLGLVGTALGIWALRLVQLEKLNK